MLIGLHHLTVAVDDLDASSLDYTRLLGREPTLASEHAGRRSLWFALDNVALELRQQASGERGPIELGFAVPDLAAADPWARQQGLGPTLGEYGVTLSGPGTGASRLATAGSQPRRLLELDPERTGGVALTLEEPSALLAPDPLDHPGLAHGLDHVVLRSLDPDRSRELYERSLGLRVALDREFDQWGVRLIFCRLAGLTVEIAAALDPATGPRPDALDPERSRDHLWGFSWRVARADDARERLATLGLDVSEVRPGRKPGTRVFTVRDGTYGVPTLMIEPNRS